MGYSRELALKKIQEYLQHAADCREMARTATAAHRQQLEQMAETWEQLAQSRQRQLHRMSGNSDVLIAPEDGPPKQ
jgi:DNA-binding transcriptional MerR regulator